MTGAIKEGAQSRRDHILCGGHEERPMEEAEFQMGLDALRKGGGSLKQMHRSRKE